MKKLRAKMITTGKNVDTAEMRRLLLAGTPGPWAVCPTDVNDGESVRPDVIDVPTGGDLLHADIFPHSEANAALIVALRNSGPALLDEIDALRAKLAESEAACAVLARELERSQTCIACGAQLQPGTQPYCEDSCSADDDSEEPDALLDAHKLIASLPASVLAHMEEDAALREVAAKGVCPDCLGDGAVSMKTDMTQDPPDQGECQHSFHAARAHLDAVRAKGGG